MECQRAAVAVEEARRAAQRAATGKIEFVKPATGGVPGLYTAARPVSGGGAINPEVLAAAQAKAAALAAQAAAMNPKFR